ncbi:MAG TPA: prepilin-type cleavage/methylation domain-containing protein [Sulfurovum sp. UBA12169]|jgi:prepilin-type N-terminal cleavage/methylation domain|nr:MAG TPA: prepilin-type cleavage/methylation domain-containing protein [Sulfurovum sp. UBA12169]
MKIRTLHSAFTLLEVTIVITILGIVASLASELIAQVYQSYILQRAEHRAALKTELAATQIANRLRYAIPGTVIRRVDTTGAPEEISTSMAHNPDDYTVLQWVAYDGDGFEAITSDANRKPGWSGFCDVDASTAHTIQTPGSNLELAKTIIENLSDHNKTIADAALYFPQDPPVAHGISGETGETLTLDGNASKIAEHYKLAWSSYALVVENGDLYLYYNFAPLPNATIGITKSLLLKNVSTFKFQGAGRTVRFKICRDENIGDEFNITSCKEKAVF